MHVCVCSVVMIVKPADYTGKKQKAEVGHNGRVKGRVGSKKRQIYFPSNITPEHIQLMLYIVCVCVYVFVGLIPNGQ